ncbi:hypothetical protein BGX27_003388, partial [Mortierella sp. AM989]
VALSCIISTDLPNAGDVFRHDIINEIEDQVVLAPFKSSALPKLLDPLRQRFREHNYDMVFLQQEIELRTPEIALCEKDGSWTSREEKAELVLSRQ